MASPNIVPMIDRLRSEIQDFLQRHAGLLALAITYGSTRLLSGLFLQLTFEDFGPAIGYFRDLGRFALGGAYPVIDYWVEYPPMYPWANSAAYLLSMLIPGDQLLWFGTFQRWILLPFDIGGVCLVYLIARKLDRSEANALRVSLLYVAAFVTLYVPLGWFDSLPLFWLLLALYLALAYRPGWSGIASGLGFLSKPIPILALPMIWQRMPSRKSRTVLLLAALTTVTLLALPFALINPSTSLAYIRNLMSRSSYQTIWALMDGYHSYGLVAPIGSRFDPSSATWAAHTGGGGYGLWSAAGFAILFILIWTRRIDWRDNRRATAFVALTWCLFALWIKGYSPQWTVNVIPFVALLMPNLRGAVYLAILATGLVAEWPVAFQLIGGQEWYLDAIIVWRTALTALLAFEFGTLVLVRGESLPRLRRAYSALAGMLVVALLLIGIRAAETYFELELSTEPLRSTIDRLRSEAVHESGLICREVQVCERISPYLPSLDMFWVPNPESWQAERLADFASQHPLLWLVEEPDAVNRHDLAVERWLSERYGRVSQEWIGEARVSRFAAVGLNELKPIHVLFGDQIVLSDYALRTKGRYLDLVLVWEGTEPIDIPYKPFVHLIGEHEEILTQNDQYPVGGFMPPNEWQLSSPVRDHRGLILPADPAGQYSLRIGWYNPATGERLQIGAPPHLQGERYIEMQVDLLAEQ